MNVLKNNVVYTYCGKCHDGFRQILLRPGEFAFTPCECKLLQDKELIYNEFFSNSGVKRISYHEGKPNGSKVVYTFDNSDKWLPELHSDVNPDVYINIYNNFLSHTCTKIMLPIQFHCEISEKNYYEEKRNYIIFQRLKKYTNQENFFSFYSNFVADIFLRRLYSVKYISYHFLLSKVLDYTNIDLSDIFQDFDVLIFHDFFSYDMLLSLKSDYKFERIFQFLHYIFSSNKFVCIFFSSRYITEFNKVFLDLNDKNLHSRVHSTLDFILNGSSTVFLIN